MNDDGSQEHQPNQKEENVDQMWQTHTHTNTQCKLHSCMVFMFFLSNPTPTINGITLPKPFIFQYFIHFESAYEFGIFFPSFRFLYWNRYRFCVLSFFFVCIPFAVHFFPCFFFWFNTMNLLPLIFWYFISFCI